MRNHHQSPAMQQRSPQFPNRKVKGVGMEQSPDVIGTEVEPMSSRAKKPRDIVMRNNYALRRSGRTRGIDDIGGVVGTERPGALDGRGVGLRALSQCAGRIGVIKQELSNTLR